MKLGGVPVGGDRNFASMKDLKVGKYVIIDDAPCRVVGIETSAPGKHGATKMRVSALDIFTGNKKTLLKPSDADIEVPMIERKNGQIVSITGETAQIMDTETFETFEMPIPEEFKNDAAAGREVDYILAMGRRLITRVAK